MTLISKKINVCFKLLSTIHSISGDEQEMHVKQYDVLIMKYVEHIMWSVNESPQEDV